MGVGWLPTAWSVAGGGTPDIGVAVAARGVEGNAGWAIVRGEHVDLGRGRAGAWKGSGGARKAASGVELFLYAQTRVIGTTAGELLKSIAEAHVCSAVVPLEGSLSRGGHLLRCLR